jgi:hypothetical protein
MFASEDCRGFGAVLAGQPYGSPDFQERIFSFLLDTTSDVPHRQHPHYVSLPAARLYNQSYPCQLHGGPEHSPQNNPYWESSVNHGSPQGPPAALQCRTSEQALFRTNTLINEVPVFHDGWLNSGFKLLKRLIPRWCGAVLAHGPRASIKFGIGCECSFERGLLLFRSSTLP